VRVYQFRHIRVTAGILPAPFRRFAVSADVTKRLAIAVALVACLLGALTFVHRHEATTTTRPTEVIVTLDPPALSHARGPLAARELSHVQDAFASALRRVIPAARIRWRYRLTLDGAAVVLPERDIARLGALPGVRAVYRSGRYELTSGPAGGQIGAPQLWAPGLTNAGDGIKIGVIDGGVDQSHPFFDPSSYTMPAGFPKGQTAFTTAKVIVARSFPPPGPTTAAERAPYDAKSASSAHGTHVAGIAAGNVNTPATGGALISGVAPRAYIGNYRAYTIPTDSGVGEDGNAPEVVAAIEAAVADGMDVINLSIGEAETEPSRDPIALALDGAAAAGVIPVVAAGNDYAEFGHGSLTSPGSSARSITVGAVTTAGSGVAGVIADFSSSGPTPLSLRLKPDVAAPGVAILSSLPGGWGELSGTSMASPHVAGGAALLRQRHPDWTVAQIKSALVETGDDAWASDSRSAPTLPNRTGGGVIDLPRADQPLLFTEPSSLSFGLLRAGLAASAQVSLTDAGGGTGTWAVAVEQFGSADGVAVTVQPTIDVPGSLAVGVTTTTDAAERDVSGYVILSRDTQTRRIPFWLRITRPLLATEPFVALAHPGLFKADTRGGPSRVSVYRYPEVPGSPTLPAALNGPERVFRVDVPARAANFGVAIVSSRPGVLVQPRVLSGADENRLTGYAGLPIVLNPYLAGFDGPVPSAGALLPLAGRYSVVFDSATPEGAGPFTFRYWVNDVTPPTARLQARKVGRGVPLAVRVADGQSGVDPQTIVARIDGVPHSVSFGNGVARITIRGLAVGRHRLQFQVSDFQETRNMENVAAVLPNTQRLQATIVVR
jgi:subtilisin family serine protease